MKAKLINVLRRSDDKIGDIVLFQNDILQFVAELKECDANDFKEGVEYEIDAKFYCHEIIGVYQNEEDFHKDVESMNVESIIPVGSMPMEENADFEPSPMNFINTVVDEVIDNALLDAPDNFVFFEGRLFGFRLDQCLYFEDPDARIELAVGDIVSGIYWAEVYLDEKVVN